MNSLDDRLRELGRAATPSDAHSVDAVIQRGRGLRRRTLTRVIAPIAAAAVVATAIVVPVFGAKPMSSTEASQFLIAVGDRAGQQVDLDPQGQSFWYVKIQHGSRGGVLETWYSRSGGGLTIKTSASGRVMSEPTELILVAGSTGVSWDELMNLPTDPEELYTWLHEAVGDAGPDPLTEMWVATWDLLRQSPAPAHVRQALYAVASRLPDVTIQHDLADSLGRPAVGISHSWPGGSTRYLVDEATGAVLEHQELIGTTVTYRDTYITQRPAEAVGARPIPESS